MLGLNHLHNISSSTIAIFTILIWGFHILYVLDFRYSLPIWEIIKLSTFLFGRLVPDVLGWAACQFNGIASNTRQKDSSIIHPAIKLFGLVLLGIASIPFGI